jgi:hypothetical protein
MGDAGGKLRLRSVSLAFGVASCDLGGRKIEGRVGSKDREIV